MIELRILLLVPARQSDADTVRQTEQIERILGTGERRVVVTSSTADWNERFPRLGTRAAWERDVVRGVRYTDRQPHYHAYVCVQTDIGKGTAGVVYQALQEGKPVLYLNQDSLRVEQVGQLHTIDPENFVSGWTIGIVVP